jgi:hypothetical protein
VTRTHQTQNSLCNSRVSRDIRLYFFRTAFDLYLENYDDTDLSGFSSHAIISRILVAASSSFISKGVILRKAQDSVGAFECVEYWETRAGPLQNHNSNEVELGAGLLDEARGLFAHIPETYFVIVSAKYHADRTT